RSDRGRVRARADRPQAPDHDRPDRVRPELESAAPERQARARERRRVGRRALPGQGVTMKILAIAGSLRRDSYNRKLLLEAAELLPAGVELELWEGLKDVPPFDEDDESGPAPAAVAQLRDAIAGAD